MTKEESDKYMSVKKKAYESTGTTYTATLPSTYVRPKEKGLKIKVRGINEIDAKPVEVNTNPEKETGTSSPEGEKAVKFSNSPVIIDNYIIEDESFGIELRPLGE